MSAVVLPAASASLTSTQVIFSNSTCSAREWAAASANPGAKARQPMAQALSAGNSAETELVRISSSGVARPMLAGRRRLHRSVELRPEAEDKTDEWHLAARVVRPGGTARRMAPVHVLRAERVA